MNSQKNYYAILGVLSTAEDVVIQGAYRALAQRYHPDRYGGSQEEANARMSEINEAYRILSDVALRAEYDRTRSSGGLSDDADVDFEVQQFRPFAERLHEWGYSAAKITEVLMARGVRQNLAEHLAQLVSGRIGHH